MCFIYDQEHICFLPVIGMICTKTATNSICVVVGQHYRHQPKQVG
uniref:Uncharacterized protein n=1 Tax=Setaria italica TaxID=4555 RepID=K3Y4A8_SETIT